MPIFFSVGFVTHASPRRPIVSVCGRGSEFENVSGLLVDQVKVKGRANVVWKVTGYWPREDGMSCDDNGCVRPGNICAPQGDDVRVLFSVYDTDGDEFDMTGATEIVFAVADEKGGPVRFVKRLTASQIQISTNGYQFTVRINAADTLLPLQHKSYYEVQVTTSAGLKKTVSAGTYKAERTIIKDL